MKCRAKMIDGSPVTFEFIDWSHAFLIKGLDGQDRIEHDPKSPHYITEMVGHGFHVISIYPDYSLHVQGDRLYADRMALERSGVDTATSERQEEFYRPFPGTLTTRISPETAQYRWVPLFPRTANEIAQEVVDTSFLESMSAPPPKGRYDGKRWSDPPETARLREMLYAERKMNKELVKKLEEHVEQMCKPGMWEGLTKDREPGVKVTYVGAEGLVTEAMLAAGCAAMRDMIAEESRVYNGTIWFRDAHKVVTFIWRAMEKARR